jgi:hypothetical protein
MILPRVSGIESTPKASFPGVVFGDNFVERMDWLNTAQPPAIDARAGIAGCRVWPASRPVAPR